MKTYYLFVVSILIMLAGASSFAQSGNIPSEKNVAAAEELFLKANSQLEKKDFSPALI